MIRAASINVQNNPDHPKAVVRAYVERMFRIHRRYDVIFFQEIGDVSDKRAVVEAAAIYGFSVYFTDTQLPIAVKVSRWHYLDRGSRRPVIDGEAGYSPDRPVPYLDLIRRKDGLVIRAISVWNVNGAWNGRFPASQDKRRRDWVRYQRRVDELTADASRVGRTVIVGGDWNRHAAQGLARPLHRGRFVASHGPDHIFVLPPPGFRFVRAKGRVVRSHAPMDHAPISARFGITAKPKRRRSSRIRRQAAGRVM